MRTKSLLFLALAGCVRAEPARVDATIDDLSLVPENALTLTPGEAFTLGVQPLAEGAAVEGIAVYFVSDAPELLSFDGSGFSRDESEDRELEGTFYQALAVAELTVASDAEPGEYRVWVGPVEGGEAEAAEAEATTGDDGTTKLSAVPPEDTGDTGGDGGTDGGGEEEIDDSGLGRDTGDTGGDNGTGEEEEEETSEEDSEGTSKAFIITINEAE